MSKNVILIYSFILLVISCKPDEKKNISITDKEDASYNGWVVDKRIKIDGLDPLGIAVYQDGIYVSDTVNKIVIGYNVVTEQLDTVLKNHKSTYINQRRGRTMMPLIDNDSVFVYGGRSDLFKFNMPFELDDPTCFDGRSTSQFALVNQGTSQLVICDNGAHTMEGEEGSGEGQFINPSSVTLSAGKYYVTDTGNKRGQIWSKQGKFLLSFGEDKNLKFPTGITASNDQYIYLCDPILKEILIFDNAGEYIESIKNLVDNPTDVYYQDSILYVAGRGEQTISMLRNKNY